MGAGDGRVKNRLAEKSRIVAFDLLEYSLNDRQFFKVTIES